MSEPGSGPASTFSSDAERKLRAEFYEHYRASPLPSAEQLENLGLFVSRRLLTRMLMFNELYGLIINVPGMLIEFGVRWGQNLALLANLRGIYEPYNYPRKLLGFDTFEGFPSVHQRDGDSPATSVGSYAVTAGYETYLAGVLDHHEQTSPLAHLRKYELVAGDVSLTVPRYLDEHPETVIAFAYFDLDLYEPTRDCLTAIRPHLTKGSVLAFDELNHPDFPGETAAVREVLGLDRYALRRTAFSGFGCYLVIE